MNEQSILTIMHTLWLREHNRIEAELHRVNRHWDGETLFQEARHMIGAMMQHITYNEFLPVIMGPKLIKLYGLQLLKSTYFNGRSIISNYFKPYEINY